MTNFDSNDPVSPLDHIGWRLWQAAASWKTRYAEEMVARGHGWYAEARSSVVPYIGKNGIRQAELVRRMGLTKQAVQQLVDDLQKVGIVERVSDPNDKRGKIVRFTEAGLAAQRDAESVKIRVEDEIRTRLGPEAFIQLNDLLKRLVAG